MVRSERARRTSKGSPLGGVVNASEWTRCKPFEPCVYGPNGPIADVATRTSFDPEWRVYGRSASDDKGPIVAVLNAVDALRATGSGPAWNLRVVLDGEEEAGSRNFRRFAAERGEALKGDLAMMLDGPRHPSGRPTLYFGVRGGAGLTLTVVVQPEPICVSRAGSAGRAVIVIAGSCVTIFV